MSCPYLKNALKYFSWNALEESYIHIYMLDINYRHEKSFYLISTFILFL